jgi:hypothetical protein
MLKRKEKLKMKKSGYIKERASPSESEATTIFFGFGEPNKN